MADKKKIILVTGATGSQGGSVVDALLKDKDGGWEIRALSRNPDNEKAKALAKKGVSVIKGDYSDEKALREGLKGAYAFFAMTNFWDPASMGKEVELGKKMVDIAKEAGVHHFIWSSLADVAKISKNKYHVPHFTDKATVEQYAISKGLHSTFIAPAFYFQNFVGFFPPKKDDKGVWVFTVGVKETSYLTAYDVEDTGGATLAALKHPNEWKNKFIPLAGSHMHPQEYVSVFSKVTGLPAKYNYVSPEDWAKFPFPGAKEMAEMFGYFNEFTYFGGTHDLSLGKKAFPQLKSFEEWLKSSGWKPQ